MLGENPTSVQNAITLAQKKDAELCIIEGLHNHDPEHKIDNIRIKIVIQDPAVVVVAHI